MYVCVRVCVCKSIRHNQVKKKKNGECFVCRLPRIDGIVLALHINTFVYVELEGGIANDIAVYFCESVKRVGVCKGVHMHMRE